MAIYDILPTTFSDRIRRRLNRSPVTPIANWDTLNPIDLPRPDADAVRRMIVERVAAHASAGSLDDAHGDLLDRVIRPICRQWSEQTRHAYEEQLRVWAFLEEQGTQHSLELGQRLARLNVDLARHQMIEDRVWAELATEDDPADRLTRPTADLAATDPLPLPAVPIVNLPPHLNSPTLQHNAGAREDVDDDPPAPMIHSV